MQPEPVPSAGDDRSSPERLLASCASGERAAFQALYREFSPAAYGLALRVLRDEHLAQDALQEAFTQVWTEAVRFDPAHGSARAWIMTLVHRRAVDRVRRDQADRQRGRAWGTGQLDVDHDSVAEIVELRAEHRRVRSALASLTPLQRQALDLAYHRGMTQTQIAAHLDIPLGTVKTRLRDALQRLRREMEGTS
jgi:RNA polymerase sigma-70 factor, ECF subfamily